MAVFIGYGWTKGYSGGNIIRFQTTGGWGPKSRTSQYEPSVGENINKRRNYT